jgi:hypothetical protein
MEDVAESPVFSGKESEHGSVKCIRAVNEPAGQENWIDKRPYVYWIDSRKSKGHIEFSGYFGRANRLATRDQ